MKATKTNLTNIENNILATNPRSAWNKGVKAYALDLLANFYDWSKCNEREGEELPTLDEVTALNGAKDWSAWAYGGCGLVYDVYICNRLCTKSEQKRYKGGQIVPTPASTWLDLEARAVRQAWGLIARVVAKIEA